MNIVLYSLVVLIWGSTWLVIAYQSGTAGIILSIFYRFVFASLGMLLFALSRKQLCRISRKDLFFCFLQGLCLYSLNYICFYYAAQSISSGMESLIFSLAVLYNAVGARIFWKQKVGKNFFFAFLSGILGLILILHHNMTGPAHPIPVWVGITLCLTGTGLFSLGNMISIRQFKIGLSPLLSNTYAMVSGTLVLFILMLVRRTPFVLPHDPAYISSLLFLSIPGTVIAFTAYLTLVNRIGPQNAAFTTLMTPIIALCLSILFEGEQLNSIQIIGVILILAANLLILSGFNIKKFSFKAIRKRRRV